MNKINKRKGHQLYVVGHQQTENLTAGHEMSPSLLSMSMYAEY